MFHINFRAITHNTTRQGMALLEIERRSSFVTVVLKKIATHTFILKTMSRKDLAADNLITRCVRLH